jgi:glycosyltransferase involved in cell wall biosynthesis
MAKILIISTFFPPRKHIASNRIESFAKYLSEFGHSITVITKGERDACIITDDIKIYYVKDNVLLRPLNTFRKDYTLVHIFKCIYNMLFLNVLVDEASAWTNKALKVARNIHKEEKFECIVSSALPIGPHIIAANLKKITPNIKLIMDMRDAVWSPSYPLFTRYRLIKLFRKLALQSDCILSVSSKQMKKYELILEDKVKCLEINNGYNFDLTLKKYRKNEVFTIAFAGTLHGAINTDNLFAALVNFADKNHNFKLRIIGTTKPIYVPQKIADKISFEDYMPYDKLITILKEETDLLVLIIPKSREEGIYSGKIFDYLGCLKPILGLVPRNDVAAQLIRDTKAGYIAENENIDEIEQNILKAYLDWTNNIPFNPNLSLIRKFHRKEQAKILDNLIVSLCRGNDSENCNDNTSMD